MLGPVLVVVEWEGSRAVVDNGGTSARRRSNSNPNPLVAAAHMVTVYRATHLPVQHDITVIPFNKDRSGTKRTQKSHHPPPHQGDITKKNRARADNVHSTKAVLDGGRTCWLEQVPQREVELEGSHQRTTGNGLLLCNLSA